MIESSDRWSQQGDVYSKQQRTLTAGQGVYVVLIGDWHNLSLPNGCKGQGLKRKQGQEKLPITGTKIVESLGKIAVAWRKRREKNVRNGNAETH